MGGMMYCLMNFMQWVLCSVFLNESFDFYIVVVRDI